MTPLQHISWCEQMEAYRRDFAVAWAKEKARLIAHCTPVPEISRREIAAWVKWMRKHYRKPKHAQ